MKSPRALVLGGGVGLVSVTGLVSGWLGALVAFFAAIGTPLFALMAGGTALAWWLDDAPVNRLAPRVLDETFAGSPVLVTIPLFTALGYLLAESKAPQRLVEASRRLMGWLPGGLAIVCLGASAFFTTLTGGSGVTIVAIGGLLLPTLEAQGWSKRFSLGLVTTGGSLGLLFPPSLPILVYALVAGLDFELAFRAGLLPGVLVLVALAAWAALVGTKERIPRERVSWREALGGLWLVRWELGLPVVILGGLGTGLTSLDESAAVGVAWTLLVVVGVHEDLTWKQVPRVLHQALSLAGAVVLILMMANALMNLVIDRQVPAKVLEAMSAVGLESRWQFLLALNLFLLVIGMVMDGVSALIVAVPLVLPLAARFGLSPFHLAMMVILNLELAFCLPPLGLNLFISSFRFRVPVTQVYRSVVPFLGVLAACLAVVTAAPSLSTVLVQPTIDAQRREAEAAGRPPREAWALECVQADALDPKPCNDADRARYATPDAGAEEEEDDALMRQLMGVP
ncbi:MAG: TRAP transporter large permease [Myxococcaceae bacterium]|nr:TRAP transporter large permease [Myxococcaceae bacterium]